MSKANRLMGVGLFLLAFSGLCRGEGEPPAPAQPRPDALSGAVDPYDAAAEKARFLAAAGVDNELSEEEFKADTGDEPFVRPFDTWKKLAAFDGDRNGRLSWLEAEACRADLRRRLLKAFDANDDGRLSGDERTRALASLGGTEAASPTPGGDGKPPRWMGPHDKDGDGQLSAEERAAAMASLRESWQKQSLERFDTDGDGQLSDEENKARREYWRQRNRRQGRQMELRFLDTDGDGEISDEERRQAEGVGRKFEAFGQEMKLLTLDLNGDGEITKLEEAAAAGAWMAEGSVLMLKAQVWADGDRDGQVSWAEREAFEDHVRGKLIDWMDRFAAPYDTDKNGRFSVDERSKLVEGLTTEMRNRMAKADGDQDGHVSAREAMAALEAFGREVGALAESPEDPAVPPREAGQGDAADDPDDQME